MAGAYLFKGVLKLVTLSMLEVFWESQKVTELSFVDDILFSNEQAEE